MHSALHTIIYTVSHKTIYCLLVLDDEHISNVGINIREDWEV